MRLSHVRCISQSAEFGAIQGPFIGPVECVYDRRVRGVLTLMRQLGKCRNFDAFGPGVGGMGIVRLNPDPLHVHQVADFQEPGNPERFNRPTLFVVRECLSDTDWSRDATREELARRPNTV